MSILVGAKDTLRKPYLDIYVFLCIISAYSDRCFSSKIDNNSQECKIMSNVENQVVIPCLRDMRESLRVRSTELSKRSRVSRSSIHKAENGLPVSKVIALKILTSLFDFSKENHIDERSENFKRIKNFLDMVSDKYLLLDEKSFPSIINAAKRNIDDFFESHGLLRLTEAQRAELCSYLEGKVLEIRKFEREHPGHGRDLMRSRKADIT